MDKFQLAPLKSDNPLAKLAKAAIRLKFVSEQHLESEVAKWQPQGYGLLSSMSHFGGEPHLPKDFKWPTAKSGEKTIVDRPLVFSVQLDLSELAYWDVNNELPHQGLMVIFTMGDLFNWQDYENLSRIYIFDDLSSLQVTKRPEEAPFENKHEQQAAQMPFHRICAGTFYTVPEEYANIFDESKVTDSTNAFGLTLAQIQDISENYEVYYGELVSKDGFEEEPDVESQLLGWGQYIQGDQVESANETLLFTLSSFFNEQLRDWSLCIGDAGAIYHVIELSDLKAHNFSRIRSQMDCY